MTYSTEDFVRRASGRRVRDSAPSTGGLSHGEAILVLVA
jgi:hypothetical protein